MKGLAILLLITLQFLSIEGEGVNIISLNVPALIEKGKSVTLECIYNMNGEILYAVKWYKDNIEFFRHNPNDQPMSQVFHLGGVNVDVQKSTNHSVHLINLTNSSSGVYTCEVSADAPSFRTSQQKKEMVVYVLPEKLPKITGCIGDDVLIFNCTSARSIPAAFLEWTVNGEKNLNNTNVTHSTFMDHGMIRSFVSLELYEGYQSLNLSCTAKIGNIYEGTTVLRITQN